MNGHATPDNLAHPLHHSRPYTYWYSKSRILRADQRDESLAAHRGLCGIRTVRVIKIIVACAMMAIWIDDPQAQHESGESRRGNAEENFYV